MTCKIYSVAQMVAAEKAADAVGYSYAAMMETAGRRVAEAVADRVAVDGRRVLVLVGPGNNGGDGLVAGRYLAEAGADVAFYLFKPRDPDQDDNLRRAQEMGLLVIEAEHDQRHRVLRTRLATSEIVLDALLGTGVTRPIKGDLARILQQVAAGLAALDSTAEPLPLQTVGALDPEPKAGQVFVCAVDCPSGLNCDTGALDPLAIPADLTVTFDGPKRGHFIFPGASAIGELAVADIGIPAELPAVQEISLSLVTADVARALLPKRPRDGHKGTFGTVLIAAGSADYWGAPVLAAQGAYRAGAGLVALAVPSSVRPVVAGQVPEATYPALAAADLLDDDSARRLLPLLRGADALLIGPGLGDAAAFFDSLLPLAADDAQRPPIVVDADGLNLLSRREKWPDLLPPLSILTPHPGEMSRLVGMPLAELKRMDRVRLAREKAQSWGHVVLLKGAYTVAAAPDGRAAQLPFANPLLSAAGSGDVLAGVIAGLLAQGLAAYEAAVLGAYLHGAAAKLAADTWGDAGLLAGELADWVPQVRRRLLAI